MPAAQPSIADHAAIGDCRPVALAPRAMQPSAQQYEGGTNVLRTRFPCATGQLDLNGFTPMAEAGAGSEVPGTPQQLVRICGGQAVHRLLYRYPPDSLQEATQQYEPLLAQRNRVGLITAALSFGAAHGAH